MALNLNLHVSVTAHSQLSYILTCSYHMEEVACKVLHIYRSCSLLEIDPRGWKGSVLYGLGVDASLPHCLATGSWNLAPKATSGPKSRGASFGRTLWRHVQRYCASFLRFMVILVIQFSDYFIRTKTKVFTTLFGKICESTKYIIFIF